MIQRQGAECEKNNFIKKSQSAATLNRKDMSLAIQKHPNSSCVGNNAASSKQCPIWIKKKKFKESNV